jgi:hypothetical protein
MGGSRRRRGANQFFNEIPDGMVRSPRDAQTNVTKQVGVTQEYMYVHVYEPVRLKSESFSFKTDTDSDNGTSRYRSAFGTKEISVLLWYYTFFRFNKRESVMEDKLP